MKAKLLKKVGLFNWFATGCHNRRLLVFPSLDELNSDPLAAFTFPAVQPYLDKLPALLDNVDEKSRLTFCRYLAYCFTCSNLEGRLVAEAANPDFPDEKFRKEKAAISRTTGIPERYILPEVFGSKLGLTWLPEPVLQYMKGKIFIDCGAFIGDSTLVMTEYDPGQIWAFDISPANAQLFQETMKRNRVPEEKIRFFLQGLGDQEGTLRFDDGHASGTSLLSGGETEAKLTTIDRCCQASAPVGFIKADLEGYGVKMIKGAAETLKRDRPVLSLAIYHNPEEFFETKPFIESLGLDYSFRIVCTGNTAAREIYLFAYPAELA